MKRLLFSFILGLSFVAIVSGQTRNPTNYWAYTDTVSFTITRPSNATTYAANDVVTTTDTTFVKFTPVNRNLGGGGLIFAALLEADTANVANATFRLYVFRDTSSSQGAAISRIGDNAAFTWLTDYRYKLVGTIDFSLSTAGTGSTSAYSYISGFTNPFITNINSRYLYGQLVATGAYQPKNGGKFYIKLWILKD